MEAQISGMTIRTVQRQRVDRDTDVLAVPTGIKHDETVRGEVWLRLWDEADLAKMKRFLNSSSRYEYTKNTRYYRTGIPCTVIGYFENTGKAVRSVKRFTPGIIFSLLQTYAPGIVMLRWIRERPVDLSNVEDVERMFAAVNRRRTQESKPHAHVYS